MEKIQQSKPLLIIEGVIFTLLGCLAVAVPVLSTISAELFIGWLFIFGGLFQGYKAIACRCQGGCFGSLLISLIYLICGILLLVYPLQGVITLTLVLTAFFIVEGISKIILAFQMRHFSRWGWLVVSGIIALILAYIIYAGWPGTAFWVLGLLIGINMIFFGLSLIFLACSLPKIDSNTPS